MPSDQSAPHKFMIRRPQRLAQRGLLDFHVHISLPFCCRTARYLSLGEKLGLWRAPNFMILPPAPLSPPVRQASRANFTPQRYCRAARCLLREDFMVASLIAPNSMIPPPEVSLAPVVL